MRLRLNTLLARLLIGTCIPLVLFVAVFLAAVLAIQRLNVALGLEQHTHQVIDEMLRLRQNFSNMRLAHRGFGLKPAQPFQNEYQANRAELRGRGAVLAELVHENSDQHERVLRLLDLEAQWNVVVVEARLLLTFRPDDQPGDFDKQAGQYQVRSAQLTDLIDGEIENFLKTEENLLEQRRAVTRAETLQSEWLIGGAAGLGFLLSLVVALSVARSVSRPVSRLREAAGQLIAGHFELVPPEGPSELADLMVYFNHMGVTLAERARSLERQTERYQRYIGATTQILWSADADGAMAGDVPTWRAYTGQGEDAVRGRGWLDAVHADDRAATAAAWDAAVRQRGVFEAEFRLRGAGGDYRDFACRGVPILNPDDGVREWVGTCTDVTDRKREAALRQAKEAAEASSRAKSEFLAKMSHELRTPLNAVIGMSRMLATRRFGPLNAKQADYVGDIVGAGQHLLALINDILDLTKVEAGRMDLHAEPFGPAEAVESALSTLRPLAEEKGVALRSGPPAGEGEMTSDPSRFKQVLYNLLSNAIKFTPAGGSVTITCQWIAEAGPESPPAPPGAAAGVRVEVRDTGIGIAPEDQKVVWDEFRQVKPVAVGAVEGTGLGLALTRRLVGLLGGSIWLQSEPGKGSTFAFVLPRRLPRAATEETGPPPEEDGGRPLTLVIEDYPPTRKLLLDWLEVVGHRTAWAADGEAGLDMARRLRPQLIVLDLVLPKRGGWQVLTELKSSPETASIPVVVVSVNEERSAAGSLDVQEYFVKPLDRDAFLRRLRELQPGLFEGNRPLTALVVDDDPAARKLLRDYLAGEQIAVAEAATGAEALRQLEATVPDVVVLDLLLPEVNGFEVVEAIRGRPEWARLPVLVVTSKDLTAEERLRLSGRIQALLAKQALTAEGLLDQLHRLGLAGNYVEHPVG
jgi:PAS domain S-box-containing protein